MGETWGEANGKLELLEVEEEIDKQHVELPGTQGENDEGEGIKTSGVEADQAARKLKQLEKVLESEQESEKPQARRSSKTRKKVIAGEEKF